MVVAGLIQEVLGILFGLLDHFVQTPAPTFTQYSDGEWSGTNLDIALLTEKGNSLMGAVADIVLYGATLVDFIMQVLVGQSIAGSP